MVFVSVSTYRVSCFKLRAGFAKIHESGFSIRPQVDTLPTPVADLPFWIVSRISSAGSLAVSVASHMPVPGRTWYEFGAGLIFTASGNVMCEAPGFA